MAYYALTFRSASNASNIWISPFHTFQTIRSQLWALAGVGGHGLALKGPDGGRNGLPSVNRLAPP